MNTRRFSSDEIEDIEDAATLTGVLTCVDSGGTEMSLAPLFQPGADYHLIIKGEAYVLVSAEGAELGRVDRITEISKLLELVLHRRPG